MAEISRIGIPFRFPQAAALAGGTGLLLHYGLHLLHGLQTGRVLWDDMDGVLGRIDGVLFAAAFLSIDCALLAIYTGLRQRRQGPSLLLDAGAVFSAVASLSVAIGLVGFLVNHMVPFAFPVGCLSMFVGALLLGIACLLSKHNEADRALPRQAASLMIVFALTTAPLGFAFETLKAVVPVYVVFEIHFVVAAVIWLWIGRLCAPAATVRPVLEAQVA